MIKNLVLVIATMSLIVVAAWTVSPPKKSNAVTYDQIRIDNVTVYPYQASAGRITFVEQVEGGQLPATLTP